MHQSLKVSEKSKIDYISRINRVMDYIETHLDQPLGLEKLADLACFSKFHFHRIFQGLTGECLSECISRIRIEKAATLLLDNPNKSITEIALHCGFASSASFANTFRKHFNKSPSQYRMHTKPGIKERYIYMSKEDLNKIHIQIDYQNGKQAFYLEGKDYKRQVDVFNLPEWRLAYIRYTGPYKGDSRLFASLWKKLMTWACPRGILEKPDNVYLVIYHDNPEITEEDKLRVSVCVSIDKDMQVSGEVGKLYLPGGKYAVCRFILGEKDYSAAWGWVYGTWLPLSGYEPDDRPAFEWYPPAEKKSKDKIPVDICIPVKII